MDSGDAVDATPAGLRNETGRKVGVLVVDDDAGVRMLLDRFLRGEGFSVWTAGAGDEGLDVYRRHVQDIHLVLLDVRMPGTDGPTTLKRLQQVNPAVCCCFISGATAPYTFEELVRLGAVAVLEKPFVLAELAERLRRMIPL